MRHLPDKIVEMILILAVQSSKEPVSTFNHLSLTCSRFNTIIQKKKSPFASQCLYPILRERTPKVEPIQWKD